MSQSATAGDPAAKELKALEGTWTVVTHEMLGKKSSEGDFVSPKELTFTKDMLQGRFVDYDLPFKIDPAKSPKQITIFYPRAMLAGANTRGIYKLEKDMLTICIPMGFGQAPPTEFSSKKAELFVLQRKK